MLAFTHSLRFLPSKDSFLCHNRCISTVAHHLFEEIPQRFENRVLGSSLEAPAVGCQSLTRKTVSVSNIDSLRKGLESFCQNYASGTKPTKFILCTVLNSCAKTLNQLLGLQIHAHVIQTGYEHNLFLSSALVDLYAKCGAIVDAKCVFNEMERHDQVSWTSMISGFSQNGYSKEAIFMFKEMLKTPVKPSCFTYVSVISSFAGLEDAFEHSTLVHVHVVKHGLVSNTFVVSALVDSYSKCGKIDRAVSLFNESTLMDNVLLNSMISGYSFNLHGEEALELFRKMRKENLNPTGHTLTSILNSCGNLTLRQQGRQVHSLVIKMGSQKNIFVATALVDMYSKCGCIDDARFIFDITVQKNNILWTSMITGYAQSGRGTQALDLFDHLVSAEGYKPDLICFTAVLTACVHAGFVNKGVEYFDKLKTEYGLVPELDQYACLIDLYAKNGLLRKAKELMDTMPFEPNHVILSSFLGSCTVYGEVELAKEVAGTIFQMKNVDASVFISLANIYGRAGLWGEVAEIRKLMRLKGIKKLDAGWSWIEVNNETHVFSVCDASHSSRQVIYAELEKLSLEMKEACGFCNKNVFDIHHSF